MKYYIYIILSFCLASYTFEANSQNTFYYNSHKSYSSELQSLADSGDPKAINNLGSCYDRGDGIQQDHKKAFELFLKAVIQKDILAYNNLGCCYEDGLGVNKDQKKAYELYAMAVDKDSTDTYSLGNLGSCYYYGKGCEKNFETAVHYLTKASEAEFPSSETLYLLSKCYRFGYGVKKDEEKANGLLSNSQKLGNDSAIMLMEKMKRLR